MILADPHSERDYYGCVFCYSTREKTVARALEEQFPEVKATTASQIKHKSEQGRKYTVEHILLPGYVFFRSQAELPANPFHMHNIIRLLKNSEGSWQLMGRDEQFARFVFEYDGVIGLSQARKAGDKVKILSGPLKELEGYIIKVDRRARNGQVEFRFDDRVWKVWLAFELME